MQNLILLHKNYTLNEEGYQLKLPLNLETIIPVDDSVRLLSQFVEAMDLTDLYSTYERINTVSPRTLLKMLFCIELVVTFLFTLRYDIPFIREMRKSKVSRKFLDIMAIIIQMVVVVILSLFVLLAVVQ